MGIEGSLQPCIKNKPARKMIRCEIWTDGKDMRNVVVSGHVSGYS
jgi:hypothetical protein